MYNIIIYNLIIQHHNFNMFWPSLGQLQGVHINYTQHFIMFSMITNIYSKKTKGSTLVELFTATGKLKKFFLTTRDVRCVHHGWRGTHQYDIQVLATHVSTCWRMCGKNLNIVLMCAASPLVNTSNISSCQKKNFFSFPLAVNNSTFGFLVINACNHGEHYKMPRICTKHWLCINKLS